MKGEAKNRENPARTVELGHASGIHFSNTVDRVAGPRTSRTDWVDDFFKGTHHENSMRRVDGMKRDEYTKFCIFMQADEDRCRYDLAC